MSPVYLHDGRFVRGDEPVVRLEDRGYLFGDGVYDAWMIHAGRHLLRREHLDRLERSCAAVGIVPGSSRAEVEALTDELLARAGVERGMIYLQWTRGVQSPRAHAAAAGLRAVLSGFARAVPPHPAAALEEGVPVIFHPDLRQRFCHVKSLNLLGAVLASNAAAAAGCHEAVLVREEGGERFVTECAHSNCYAVEGGAILTAPPGERVLAGVTRRVLLDLAQGLGIRVVEEFVTPERFAAADEVFISAASGVLPVKSIDGRPVGGGRRPIHTALARAYDAFVAERCG